LEAALHSNLARNSRYANKTKRLQSVHVIDFFSLESPMVTDTLGCLLIVGEYAEGDSEHFVIPISLIRAEAAKHFVKQHPQAAIMHVETAGERQLLCEASSNDHFWRQLLSVVANARKVEGTRGSLLGTRNHVFEECWDDSLLEATPTAVAGELSNNSATFGDRIILKLVRRATPSHPDLEIGSRLSESAESAHVPRVVGAIECEDRAGRTIPFAVLQEYVPNVGDAWTYTLDELRRFFERVQSRSMQELNQVSEAAYSPRDGSDGNLPVLRYPQTLAELMNAEPSHLATNSIGGYLHLAELLGRQLGELHRALANIQGDPAFSREPFTRLYQRSLYQSLRNQTRSTLNLLRSHHDLISEQERSLAEEVVESETELLRSVGGLLNERIDAERIRCHGECHLGHTLFTGKDFVFIDFEGDTDRPVSERRIKASPLRDVASMLRSLSLISESALRGQTTTHAAGHGTAALANWASFWCGWTSAYFLRAYLLAAHPGGFLPRDDRQLRILLGTFLLEQALSEVRACIADNSVIRPSLGAVLQISKRLWAEIA
jgi:maltose alpha-D-glucosyltransferase/alpha-amylase